MLTNLEGAMEGFPSSARKYIRESCICKLPLNLNAAKLHDRCQARLVSAWHEHEHPQTQIWTPNDTFLSEGNAKDLEYSTSQNHEEIL